MTHIYSHITGSKLRQLNHHHVGRGILAHHPSGPQNYIVSLGDCMFLSRMELVTCPNECFVQVGFRNWPPHMPMSHMYLPAHAAATAPACRHTHASASTHTPLRKHPHPQTPQGVPHVSPTNG
ncbi:hypothetical protein O181_047187 [Austropuccinia psidii MF-1]|uniref:Uncharacterized protein n=1 Tax=Austropuccinia psidii MF-1 TaxID=1389203 RepID=A0A9Q3DSQ0_9BASI|nr:hypothetical protein [Austropuccinia psidii MF-1]